MSTPDDNYQTLLDDAVDMRRKYAALEAQNAKLKHENGTTEHVLTLQTERIAELKAQNQTLREVLLGASHALRSYQYGNSAPDLAEEAANAIDAALAVTEEEKA